MGHPPLHEVGLCKTALSTPHYLANYPSTSDVEGRRGRRRRHKIFLASLYLVYPCYYHGLIGDGVLKCI